MCVLSHFPPILRAASLRMMHKVPRLRNCTQNIKMARSSKTKISIIPSKNKFRP